MSPREAGGENRSSDFSDHDVNAAPPTSSSMAACRLEVMKPFLPVTFRRRFTSLLYLVAVLWCPSPANGSRCQHPSARQPTFSASRTISSRFRSEISVGSTPGRRTTPRFLNVTS